VNDSFPNALKTIKNVRKEYNSPWHIVLGSMDMVLFCVLANLSLWMELNLKANPNALLSPYLFNFCNDSCRWRGAKVKETAHNMMNKIVGMAEDFNAGSTTNGGIDSLGSHSIRKFVATHAANQDVANTHHQDTCGQWKSMARVSDVDVDTELPFPNVKVAQKLLCIGGTCYYLFSEQLTNKNDVDTGLSTITMLKTFILSKQCCPKTFSQYCSIGAWRSPCLANLLS
jgi:hypothetical protein